MYDIPCHTEISILFLAVVLQSVAILSGPQFHHAADGSTRGRSQESLQPHRYFQCHRSRGQVSDIFFSDLSALLHLHFLLIKSIQWYRDAADADWREDIA